MAHNNGSPAFAIWITGLPASGKSTLARALKVKLREHGVDAAVLESDALRPVVDRSPEYDQSGRDSFYRVLAHLGSVLTDHGVPVIFDATANRRAYRDGARRQIQHFLEVYVQCPLRICEQRDPKGIYESARYGQATNVPGVQAIYEAPEAPDVLIHGDRDKPDFSAERVIEKLAEKGYLTALTSARE